MTYNAVPPPSGLYSAPKPSKSSGTGKRVSGGSAGGQSQARRDGGVQGPSSMRRDDGNEEGVPGVSRKFEFSSSSRVPMDPEPTSQDHAQGTRKSFPLVRSPTPTKLPLPSPGLLPTPRISARQTGGIRQPDFAQHNSLARKKEPRNEAVPQGLQRPLQASNSYVALGSSPVFRQSGSHARASPAALSYSAAQEGSARGGVVHQHDVTQSSFYGGERQTRSAYQQRQGLHETERSFGSSVQKAAEQSQAGGPRSPLLATPARKIAFSDDQGATPAKHALLMTPPLGDGLLFSPPRDRGLLASAPPSQRIEPLAPPLLQRPVDLFEEIERSFGMQTSIFNTAFGPTSQPQTPSVRTPAFKAQTLKTPAAKRPPLHAAPSPALLPTPGKLAGDAFLTPAKQVQDAAAAAWAMVSGTPGILPSPAHFGTNQKAPAVIASPARAPYPEHWRPEEISQGVKRGELFKAVLRVNAFRRMEAYVTIEGVGTDVLIDVGEWLKTLQNLYQLFKLVVLGELLLRSGQTSALAVGPWWSLYGLIAQNRAIEGDTVYIKVDPPSKWPFVKGAKPDETASESSSASGLSSVLEKLNLGTTRGGMFGLEDSGDDESDRGSLGVGSLGTESSFAESLGSRFAGNPTDRTKGELTNGHGGVLAKENGSEGPDEVQRELDDLLRQLRGAGRDHGRGGGSVGSMETEDGSAVGSLEGRSARARLAVAESEEGGDRDTCNDTESLSEGDLYSCRGSEAGTEEERRQSPSEKAVEKLAAELRASPNRRPTGFVVGIAEFSSRREALVGYLQILTKPSKPSTPAKPSVDTPVKDLFQESGNDFPTFTAFTSPSITLMPADPRMPKMTVWVDGLPDGLKERVREGDPTVNTTLVAARLDCWKAQHYQPLAVVRQSLGQAGEIETETAAIMFMYKIHGPDFPQEALECLPPTPWGIPLDELARRRDLRGERIFTIDPPTARDLDDAVSVKRLGNGNVEIGVHIADVSFFVRPGTELDKEARRRSTSVYLIQRVLPMLPPLLCEQLCSLNSGVDRLAFSVIWELTPRGDIVRQWMGRTVIASCCKLAYGHAQAMIEDRFDPDNFVPGPQTGPKPPALHGNHAWGDVIADVIALSDLARALRRARFESGALRLDNTKVVFKLDADGNPDGVAVYESLEANRLIEEFMLLANRSVAGAISRAFPEAALLRRHPPPNERKLEELAKLCEAHGFDINLSSAGALHASLEEIRAATAHDAAIADVIRLSATKPMNLAKYFCTGELLGAPEDWGHYALATPLYTHFTSPIRRYPDLVVHRTLAAALEAESNLCEFQGVSSGLAGLDGGDSQPFTGPVPGDVKEALLTWHGALWDDEKGDRGAGKRAVAVAGKAHGVPENAELQGVATYCNERKLASKQAQEASDKVFLCVLLKRRGGMVSDARVVSIGPKWATVYVTRFGLERRIYFEDLQGAQAEFFESTRTVVIGEARESGRSAKKAARKAAAVEEYGDALAEDAAAIGVEAAVLPMTLRMLSSVPVVCYAITGNNRPMDIGVRLYL